MNISIELTESEAQALRKRAEERGYRRKTPVAKSGMIATRTHVHEAAKDAILEWSKPDQTEGAVTIPLGEDAHKILQAIAILSGKSKLMLLEDMLNCQLHDFITDDFMGFVRAFDGEPRGPVNLADKR